MRYAWIYGRRLLEWLFMFVIGHGILEFLATREIFPDKIVASMITAATGAPIWAHWVMAGAFGLLGTFILERFLWSRYSSLPHLAAPPQQIGQDDLQIIIGSGANYERTESDNQNRIIKSVFVGVKNQNGNTFIANCNLYMKLPNEQSFRQLNDGTFTLHPREEKFFSVAYRHEYIIRPAGAIDSIQFSIPSSHGVSYLSGAPNHSVPRGIYYLTLKSEAIEAKPYEIVCKLWVDESDRLRLTKA